VNSSQPATPTVPPNSNQSFSTAPFAHSEASISTLTTELRLILVEVQKGVNATYDAECRVADRQTELDRAYALCYINTQGTVEDRKQIATLKTAEERLAVDLAKAEWNRCKSKMKALEMSQMSLQTQCRLIETELKTLK